MELRDIFPPNGRVQRLYCSQCGGWLDLIYKDFDADVSGVWISLSGLPFLRCIKCGHDHFPDRSRFAIIDLHRQAHDRKAASVRVTRRKLVEAYGFTGVPFLYDPDDYHYIPGLHRVHDVGFLTPVFFKRSVLLKYDSAPGYRVRFASKSYGDIVSDEEIAISFGINRNGKVLMWLGDIARLPLEEQYYLRSENVESDHSVGSEFYEGQIECKFTEVAPESELFALRSQFVEGCLVRFKRKIAHLDAEVMSLALDFAAPIIDTPKERRHIADTMNKIYIESFDNKVLAALVRESGGDPKSLGNLKLLQMLLNSLSRGEDVQSLMTPLFVLYDLRVAYSHLTSQGSAAKTLSSVASRLQIETDPSLEKIYDTLIKGLLRSFRVFAQMVGP